MRRVVRFLLFSILQTSVFAASCALALCGAAETLFCGTAPNLISPLHMLVFGGTLVEYNVHALFNSNMNSGMPLQNTAERSAHIAFVILGVLLSARGIPDVSRAVAVLCALFALLSFAYSTPLLPFTYKKRLKDFGLTKICVLTAVWVGVTTILPAAESGYSGSLLWTECLLRVLLIFPLCIVFDIRDANADDLHGIRTLPNTVGVEGSYRILYASIILFALCGAGFWLWKAEYGRTANILLTAAATYGATAAARRYRTPFAYLMLVDGVMLVYALGSLFAGNAQSAAN